MVDRTKYPADQVPDLALRQVFGRQRLPENLCLLLAGCGLLNVETVAMLGESITSVKTTLKTIVADEDKLGGYRSCSGNLLDISGSSVEDVLNSSRAFRRSACQDGGRSDKSA